MGSSGRVAKFVACLFFAASLFALDDDNTSIIATMENDPSVVINGSVNAITGDPFLFEEDLVIQGVEPIRISRYYVAEKEGHWQMTGDFAKACVTKEADYRWVVWENDAPPIIYKKMGKVKIGGEKFTRWELSNLNKGFSNTSRGKISSRTNLGNNYILFDDTFKSFTVHCANGSVRRYKEVHKVKGSYQLLSEHLPNGNWILYDYEEFHKKTLLVSIRTTNPSQDKTYASAFFFYDDPSRTCKDYSIQGSDGQSVRYVFQTVDGGPPNSTAPLSDVVSSCALPEKLLYREYISEQSQQRRLESISSPHPRFKFKFYTKDKENVAGVAVKMDDPRGGYDRRRNRVQTISVPVGFAHESRATHTFLYDFTGKKNSVYDCDGNRTDYHFDDAFRLHKLERYAKDASLLNVEINNWTSVDDHKDLFKLKIWLNAGLGPFPPVDVQHGNLLSKIWLDGERCPVVARYYSYDKRGNILEEKFLGNLTGQGIPLSFGPNKNLIEDGAEAFIRRYRYSSSEPNLLLEEQEESGLRVVHDYLPNTDLPIAELTYDRDKILFRKFFEYNADHILVREISDDGSSPDKNDLSDVAVRTIRQIIPLSFGPYIGMPYAIREKYWENGSEYLLRRTVFQYGTAGLVTKKEIYDAEGKYRYSTTTSYDEKGRPVEQTDPIGQITKISYDPSGNIASTSNHRVSSRFVYDRTNRPISVEKIGDDGISETSLFSYDLKNNLLSEVDPFGSTTSYVYDPLSRRTEIHLPPIPAENGDLLTPTIRQSHDHAGNVAQHLDSDSALTYTTYNAYGKPTTITHPDGAQEQYIYNRKGDLITSIDPLGVTTSYHTDPFGRVLHKTISSKGNVLAEEHFEYRGALLTLKIDAEGNKTFYTYDGAGRRIGEECSGEKTTFAYDSLGRLRLTQRGDLCTITERDLLDRVTEERIESSSGILLQKIRYEYDGSGNRSAIIRFVAGKEEREELRYDSLNRLIQKINPLLVSETTSYDVSPNAHNQKVLVKTHTDPMGLQTIETHDALKRIASVEKRKGKTLALQETYHSPGGCLTLQIDTLFSPTSSHPTRTRRICDSRGRLTTLIEAEGEPKAKTTRYSYTARGELSQEIKSPDAPALYFHDDLGKLAQKIKPPGATLLYSYDDLGRLSSLLSADQSVHHHMQYNRLGHLIAVDGIRRTVDARGRLLSESFPSGYTIDYEYDAMGRRSSCAIPMADCLIEYEYDPLHLKAVHRKTLNHIPLYSHAYTAYDLSGNLLSEELIQDRGTVQYAVDSLSRRTKINAPSFIQDILQFDRASNILQMQLQDDILAFSYDDLYQFTSERTAPRESQSLEAGSNELLGLPAERRYAHDSLNYGNARFTYDTLDRLIQIETPLLTQTFSYDFFHRRLSKTTFKEGVRTTTHFLYDHQNEIGSFDETLTVRELRILGATPHAEIGAAVAIELNGHPYAPLHDIQGNVAALLSDTPSFYRYTFFGEETHTGHPLNPWRFCSKRIDPETQLVNFGRRYYLPTLSRWLTPDPEGFRDGMNLYAYVHNDSLTHIDEYGLAISEDRSDCLNVPRNYPYHWSTPLPTPIDLGIPPSWNIKHNGVQWYPLGRPLPRFSPHFYVNGIWNTRRDNTKGAQCLSRTFEGKSHIIPFYSESFGILNDLVSTFRTKWDPNYSTAAIRALKSALLMHIAYMDYLQDPRKVFITAFSRGTADTYHACKDFSFQQRDRLIITACGPIMILPRWLGFSVVNLVSEGDWCSKLYTGLPRNLRFYDSYANVYMLPQIDGFSGVQGDHFFQSKTYQEAIKQYTVPLYNKYGVLP